MSTSRIEALASACARIAEEALREADNPNAKFYTQEEVMQAMQDPTDRAQDKSG